MSSTRSQLLKEPPYSAQHASHIPSLCSCMRYQCYNQLAVWAYKLWLLTLVYQRPFHTDAHNEIRTRVEAIAWFSWNANALPVELNLTYSVSYTGTHLFHLTIHLISWQVCTARQVWRKVGFAALSSGVGRGAQTQQMQSKRTLTALEQVTFWCIICVGQWWAPIFRTHLLTHILYVVFLRCRISSS